MASIDQLNSVLQGAVTNISQLVTTLQAIFPRIFGSFTLTANPTTTVTQPSIQANSLVFLFPTNASAATLQGSNKSLYLSTLSAGTGFTVATAAGTNAVGTETFIYFVINPS